MKYEVGSIVLGKVVTVKPYALFMEFDDGVRGLLHISEISDSYIRDIEKFGTVGDEMKVLILSIDDSNGFLRVSLKRVPSQDSFTTHVNDDKRIPDIGEEDFRPLKEKLPEWMENTLNRMKEEKKND